MALALVASEDRCEEIDRLGEKIAELSAHIVAGVANGDSVPATTPGLPPDVWSRLYEDFEIVNGRIRMSDRPGLGLTFDRSFLDRYRVASV